MPSSLADNHGQLRFPADADIRLSQFYDASVPDKRGCGLKEKLLCEIRCGFRFHVSALDDMSPVIAGKTYDFSGPFDRRKKTHALLINHPVRISVVFPDKSLGSPIRGRVAEQRDQAR
jgi:hypothetical protein